MGTSPRLGIILSYPGETGVELVARKAELIVASNNASAEVHKQEGIRDTTAGFAVRLLQSLIASYGGQEDSERAFALTARLQAARIPGDKHYVVTLKLLHLLGIEINPLAKQILADKYPV